MNGHDGRRGAGRGRHHIASVAHHFLGARESAAAPALLVAAAESLPLTAYVAAGAARTAAIAAGVRCRLLEDAGGAWSAAVHLAGDDRVAVAATADAEPGAAGGPALCWHFSAATPGRLDAWVGACRLPGCALPTAGRRVHLFWCVAADAAGALAPLGTLARLATLVDPRRVDLVVAPRGWPHRGGGAATAAEPRALDRLRDRAADLCGRPVRLGVIGPGMGTAAAAAVLTEFLHADAGS